MGANYSYSDPLYQQKQSIIAKTNWKKGLYASLVKPLEIRNCKNPDCRNLFKIKPYDPKLFCSKSCAASINNSHRKHSEATKKKISLSLKNSPIRYQPPTKPRIARNCQNCGKQFSVPPYLAKSRKFCGAACAIRWIGHQTTSPKAARGKSGIRNDIDSTICFYSRWEANFARVLNYVGIRWQFGARSFDLGIQTYRPDFYLPDHNVYIEIKNFLNEYSDRRDRLFRKLYPQIRLILILKEGYLELSEEYSKLILNWEYS